MLAPTACADVTVMPIGYSRVKGDPPEFDTWRYPLAQRIAAENCGIDLVGTLDGLDYGSVYDDDHASLGGYTTHDIIGQLPRVLRRIGEPDVAIVSIGGNDLQLGDRSRAILGRVDEIISILQCAHSEMVIILEQIAPGSSHAMAKDRLGQFDGFNSGIGDLLAQRSRADAPIYVADIRVGFTQSMLVDDVHMNADGAAHVASVFWRILSDKVGLC
ncbi:MAG: GDSL-type esterase/lipase family protein [Marinovum sp.]|nr:GDSL-type esterase/lipase family protein [Marinovum sp.]